MLIHIRLVTIGCTTFTDKVYIDIHLQQSPHLTYRVKWLLNVHKVTQWSQTSVIIQNIIAVQPGQCRVFLTLSHRL